MSDPLISDRLSPDTLQTMHAYWRAANYLSVGQIYLQHNALLQRPLTLADIKPRLLGHWGTTPGLNLLYVHLYRLIKVVYLNMIYVMGPGRDGPGIEAHRYLEGSYTEHYPAIERNRNGLQRLFRQVTWPQGFPRHVSPEVPGSFHEGGELGCSLAHAYGAAFDNPDLIVACVVGDGEAETGALAASWHANKFLNPARDGVVLPILHLNGYQIANPTVLARISREELTDLMRGYGHEPHFVEGDNPVLVHQALAGALDAVLAQIRQFQNEARSFDPSRTSARPRGPMIVLRTPKGWAGPKRVDGKVVEGNWRLHQMPIAEFKTAGHVGQLESGLRGCRLGELFDQDGRFLDELARLAPTGQRRMGCNPHANGGALLQPLSGGKTTTVFRTRTPASSTTWPAKKPTWRASTCRPTPNSLLSMADHCLRSRVDVNLIIAGKQAPPQWLDMDAAVRRCAAGAGIWDCASNNAWDTDVVMGCAGDVPTLEALAAVTLLRSYVPDMRIRFVNVVDRMVLQPHSEHRHGLAEHEFDALFTTDKRLIFAVHGYPVIIHKLTYRRRNRDNIHVRSNKDVGTTTTPLDMVVAEQPRPLPTRARRHGAGFKAGRPGGGGDRPLRDDPATPQARHRRAWRRHAGGAGMALDVLSASPLRKIKPQGEACIDNSRLSLSKRAQQAMDGMRERARSP